MKRFNIKALALLVALGGAAVSKANAEEGDLSFGIIGNVGGVSMMGGEEVEGMEKKGMTIGFGGGLFAGYMFTDMLGIQGGAEYANRSTKSEAKTKPEENYKKTVLHGVDIPVLLTVAPMEELKINVGVVPSIVFKAAADGKTANTDISDADKKKAEENVSKFNVGAELGASYEIAGLMIGVGGKFFFMDVMDKDKVLGENATEQAKQNYKTTRAVSYGLQLGYNFARLME